MQTRVVEVLGRNGEPDEILAAFLLNPDHADFGNLFLLAGLKPTDANYHVAYLLRSYFAHLESEKQKPSLESRNLKMEPAATGLEHLAFFYPLDYNRFVEVARQERLESAHRHLEGAFVFKDIQEICEKLASLTGKHDFFSAKTLAQIQLVMAEKGDNFNAFLNQISTRWLLLIIKKATLEGIDPKQVIKIILEQFFEGAIADNLGEVKLFSSIFALCLEGDLDPLYQARPPMVYPVGHVLAGQPRVAEEQDIYAQWQGRWQKDDPTGPTLEQFFQVFNDLATKYREQIDARLVLALRREQKAEQANTLSRLVDHGPDDKQLEDFFTLLIENQVGVDLCGYELAVPFDAWKEFFDLLRQKQISASAHVLEMDAKSGAESLDNFEAALEAGVTDLGHGTHLFRPEPKAVAALQKFLQHNRNLIANGQPPVTIAVSISSNITTGVHQGTFASHPLLELIRGHHPLTKDNPELVKEIWSYIRIVCDDPAIFGSLTDEWYQILCYVIPYVYPKLVEKYSARHDQLDQHELITAVIQAEKAKLQKQVASVAPVVAETPCVQNNAVNAK